MATNFKDVLESLPEAQQKKIEERKAELLAELPLQDLRKARALTQEELADVLDVNQPSISKLERRADMYISTLRRFVEAMGGELEISACFPEGRVRIKQFEDLEEGEEDGSREAHEKVGTPER